MPLIKRSKDRGSVRIDEGIYPRYDFCDVLVVIKNLTYPLELNPSGKLRPPGLF